MGYRLYVYEIGKENYDICLFKFYAYANYKYVKPSWEYLWPRVMDQFSNIPDSFRDENECKDAYESLHIAGFKCVVHAIIFRRFIDRYIMGRNKWVTDADLENYWPTGIIDINAPEWTKLKELYNSDCDKVLDWG
jgi:hypothetical protein